MERHQSRVCQVGEHFPDRNRKADSGRLLPSAVCDPRGNRCRDRLFGTKEEGADCSEDKE